MQGLHLTADLYGCRCDPAWLTDARMLGDWCLQAAEAVGLRPVDTLFHTFPPNGQLSASVSATVLLERSHLCLHTWPDRRSVTADVYVSDSGGAHGEQARGLMLALVERLQPEWTEQRSLDRGDGE